MLRKMIKHLTFETFWPTVLKGISGMVHLVKKKVGDPGFSL